MHSLARDNCKRQTSINQQQLAAYCEGKTLFSLIQQTCYLKASLAYKCIITIIALKVKTHPEEGKAQQIETPWLMSHATASHTIISIWENGIMFQTELVMSVYLRFPASFGSIVPKCSHTLKITSWICHLEYKYKNLYFSTMSIKPSSQQE